MVFVEPQQMIVADTAGVVSYANRRWYDMGYQQHQLLSRPLEELIVPARRQALNDAFAATLAGFLEAALAAVSDRAPALSHA